MGGNLWPAVGQTAFAIPSHASNLKSEIQQLLVYSQGYNNADLTESKPIPFDVFKSLSDSALALVDKVLDQPSMKELADAVEKVSQTTKMILANVQAVASIKGGDSDVPAASETAPARGGTATAEQTGGHVDLLEIPPQLQEAMGTMPSEVVGNILEVRRKGLAALQAPKRAENTTPDSKTKPLRTIDRPVGLKVTAPAHGDGGGSKLVLESQNIIPGIIHDKIYTQLNADTRQIRLVKLFREPDPNLDIKCELCTVSLDANPIYKALSYTWGDANDTVPIKLDGYRFPVTRNLKKALLRLRGLDTDTLVWIDALCINQVNFSERMQQVQLMRAIFGSPSEVIVWLGDLPSIPGDELWDDNIFGWNGDKSDVPRINTIMEFTESFIDTYPQKSDPRSANPYILGFFLMRLLAGDIHPKDISLLRNPRLRSLCLGTLSSLVRQPWWNRIWVVQEVVLPSNVNLIFGRFTAPLRMYAEAASNLERHLSSCCASVLPTDNHTSTPVKEFGRKISEIVDAGILWSKKENVTLLNLLGHFYSRDATDSRDKVYGLLSLVTDWGNGNTIKPDYAIAPSEIYREVAFKSIEVSQSLAILEYRNPQDRIKMRPDVEKIIQGALWHNSSIPKDHIKAGIQEYVRKKHISSPEPVQLELPSWVIDWEHLKSPGSGNLLQALLNGFQVFNASASKPAPVAPIRYTHSPILFRTAVLTISAICIGSIKEDHKSIMPLIVNQFQSIDSDSFPLPSNPGDLVDKPYIGGGSEYNAIWRTICGDSWFLNSRSDHFRRAQKEDLKAIQTWRSWLIKAHKADVGGIQTRPVAGPSSSEEERLLAEADRAVRSACVMRRFFRTENGYMGLAGSGAMNREKVFVLLGSRVPFVLKELGEIELEGGDKRLCYSVTGECYVHGVMDGELARREGVEIQELCLI